MRMKPTLTIEDVFKIVTGAKAACKKLGREATIAVVDNAGHLLYLERPDQNGVNTVEMSTLKARTAALRKRPSSTFGDRVKEMPAFLAVPNCLGAPGGVPVLYQGECIGGVGVSGVDFDDEIVAKAGADVIQDR
jgi:glc operon protein GlcG